MENIWKMWAKSAPLTPMCVRGLDIHLIHYLLHRFKPLGIVAVIRLALFLASSFYRWQFNISRRKPDIITLNNHLYTTVRERTDPDREIFNRAPKKATEQINEHSAFEEEQKMIGIYIVFQFHAPIRKPVPLYF